MSSLPPFLDVLKALGPTLIAIFVAYVAWQQWRLAKENYREKLFDRRFKVYEATQNALSSIYGDEKKSEDGANPAETFFREKLKAPFLFPNSEEIDSFLKELAGKLEEKRGCEYILRNDPLPTNSYLGLSREELDFRLDTYGKLERSQTWALKQHEVAKKLFRTHLTLR